MQTGAEAYEYFKSANISLDSSGLHVETPGDAMRGMGRMAMFTNFARLGAVGLDNGYRLLKGGLAESAYTKSFIGKYGDPIGLWLNVADGAFQFTGNIMDFSQHWQVAANKQEKGNLVRTLEEREIGVVLNTANDAYPFASKMQPLTWASWLTGKLADRAASITLTDSGYKPVNIGQDYARAMMPLVNVIQDPILGHTGLGKSPDWKDPASATSRDERLAITYGNTVARGAGIGTGVTYLGMTTVEVLGVGYLTRGQPDAIYATLNVDHALKRGLDIYTDRFWQRPQEREAAVAKAGLDPKADPFKVEYEQPTAIHRMWAGAVMDVQVSFLKGRQAFDKTSANDNDYLKLVDKYEHAKIDTSTNRGIFGNAVDKVISPHAIWTTMKMTNPALMAADKIPEAIGYTAAATTTAAEATWDFGKKAWDYGSKAVDKLKFW